MPSLSLLKSRVLYTQLDLWGQVLDALDPYVGTLLQNSDVTKLRSAVLEIFVRLAQGMEVIPEGAQCTINFNMDTMIFVDFGGFSNVNRTTNFGPKLAFKTLRHVNEKSEHESKVSVALPTSSRNSSPFYFLPYRSSSGKFFSSGTSGMRTYCQSMASGSFLGLRDLDS